MLLLILGVGPAAVGMALQGLLFARSDLLMDTINVSALRVPLFAIYELAKRIIAADRACVDLAPGDVLKLSLAFQRGDRVGPEGGDLRHASERRLRPARPPAPRS